MCGQINSVYTDYGVKVLKNTITIYITVLIFPEAINSITSFKEK